MLLSSPKVSFLIVNLICLYLVLEVDHSIRGFSVKLKGLVFKQKNLAIEAIKKSNKSAYEWLDSVISEHAKAQFKIKRRKVMDNFNWEKRDFTIRTRIRLLTLLSPYCDKFGVKSFPNRFHFKRPTGKVSHIYM